MRRKVSDDDGNVYEFVEGMDVVPTIHEMLTDAIKTQKWGALEYLNDFIAVYRFCRGDDTAMIRACSVTYPETA